MDVRDSGVTVGHNNPPGMIETSQEVAKSISEWAAENPVVQTEEQARDAKLQIDRAKLCLKDLEDERDKKVRPLNERVKEINDQYRGPRSLLERIADDLGERTASFLCAEEARREALAAAARKEADEAANKALEAIESEKTLKEDASCGEIGGNLAEAINTTDNAVLRAEKSERAALIAEKDSHVKVVGGFTKALSLRTKENLIIENPFEALDAIGLNNDITEAILKSARAYRRLHGTLPAGIKVEIERKV